MEVKASSQPPINTDLKVLVDLPNVAENYEKYKEYYKLASTCHPFLIAAIHYRETNFGTTNAWNGQGIFQNIRNKYEPNSQITDWNEQVNQACNHLKGKVKTDNLTDLNNLELIATALARYNGCEGKAWRQCAYTANGLNIMPLGTATKCAVDFRCNIRSVDNKHGTIAVILLLQSKVK